MSNLGLFNSLLDLRVSYNNSALFALLVQCLAKGIKLRPLNYTKRQVLYDNKSNQGLGNNYLEKVLLKNLGIKLCNITINLCLVVILLKLLTRSRIGLIFGLIDYNLIVSLQMPGHIGATISCILAYESHARLRGTQLAFIALENNNFYISYKDHYKCVTLQQQ